jgi:group I intron endonuclease
MIGIYKITNPKGKIYIGQTIDYDRRKKEYIRQKGKGQPLLHKSILEYEAKNHKFEIIEECSIHQLNKQETYWKQYYVNQIGWKNMLFCHIIDGKGGFKSLETRQKMSDYSKNRTKEHNQNISKALLGYKQSEQHKINRSKSTTGHRNKPGKIIIQYDLNMNKINEYKSANEAGRCINKSGNQIADCASGRQKTAFNFKWKYKN